MSTPESQNNNLDLLIALIPNNHVLDVLNGDKEGEITKENITNLLEEINVVISDSDNEEDTTFLKKVVTILTFVEQTISDNEKIDNKRNFKNSLINLSLSTDDDLDNAVPAKENSPKLVTEKQLKIIEQIIKDSQNTTKEQFTKLSSFLKSLNKRIVTNNHKKVQIKFNQLLEVLTSLKNTNAVINDEINDLKSTLKSLIYSLDESEKNTTNAVNNLRKEVFEKIDKIIPLHSSISEYDLKAAQDSLREYEGETETFVWNN